MIELPLTRGYRVQVDDSDAESLSAWKWTYLPNGRSGYAIRWETADGKRRTIYMHRQIMEAGRGDMVDHEDGNGLNNQRSNLRLCGQTHNLANRPAPARTIPYRGVYAETRGGGRAPYFACIKAFRKSWHLGMFAEQEAAARAYDRAALHFFGDFARLNFPDEIEQTRLLPLAPSIARSLNEQLELPLDAFPTPPTIKADWIEISTLRRWRERPAAVQLADDWDDGLL